MRYARLIGVAAVATWLVTTPARVAAAETPNASADAAGTDVAQRPAVHRAAGNAFGFRVYGFVDEDLMAASKTFNAELGTSSLTAPGFGGEVIQGHLFARVGISSLHHDGTRVFVFADEVNSLGIPTTIGLRPIEFSLGWRSTANSRSTFAYYAGGGYLRIHFTETSEFAGAGDNTDEELNGYNVFGGVDIRLLRWMSFGAEAQYRGVPNAIGGPTAPVGSPAQAFGETDLGGTTIRVMIGVGH